MNRALPYLLLLVVVLGCTEDQPKPKQEEDLPPTVTAQSSPEAVIDVTAPALFAAYEANEVLADENYKGKILRVSGRVDSIGKDILDTMYVTLSSGKEFSIMNIQCMFDDQHKQQLAQLKKGQQIVVVGTCHGKFGNVLLRDSRIE